MIRGLFEGLRSSAAEVLTEQQASALRAVLVTFFAGAGRLGIQPKRCDLAAGFRQT